MTNISPQVVLLKEHQLQEYETLLENSKTVPVNPPLVFSLSDVLGNLYSAPTTRFTEPTTVDFPPIYARFAKNIRLGNEIIPFVDNLVIADHLTRAINVGATTQLSSNSAFNEWMINQYSAINFDSFIEIEELTLVVHNEGGGTWGHFLIQNLPKIILFHKLYPHGKIAVPRGFFGGFWNGNYGEALNLAAIPGRVFNNNKKRTNITT